MRELREREALVAELQASLDEERETRRRLTEPLYRLQTGIEAFNGSKHREAVARLSAAGQPRVRVAPAVGEDPPVRLTFAWPGGDWRTYAAHPGSPVERPRVYLLESGGGVSKVEPENANARLDAGGPGIFRGVEFFEVTLLCRYRSRLWGVVSCWLRRRELPSRHRHLSWS